MINRRNLIRSGGLVALSPLHEIFGQNASSKVPHFEAKAKRVIFLLMPGGPSHIDTFQYKPEVQKHAGKYFDLKGSGDISETEVRGYKQLVKSPYEFKPRGESGLMISEAFPHLSQHADDLCLLNGMHCTSAAHPQGQLALHTGVFNFSRPSMAAWINYALGTENLDLPGALILGKVNQVLRVVVSPCSLPGGRTEPQGRRTRPQHQAIGVRCEARD
ncbi:MAG: DUF1501 domain-containing protein [Verrucomicrobiota bacterium]